MDIGGGDRALRSIVVLALFLLMLAGCSSSSPPGVYKLGQPYQIHGRWYYPEYDPHYDRVGTASWYGEPFHGRATANGERFDRKSVSAAHPTLPLPSLVRVVNLSNHRELVVRVNDRGPFVDDRLIDLSQEAARQLGFERQGLARVRVQFVRLAEAEGEPPQPTAKSAPAPMPARPAEPAPPLVAAAPAPHPVATAPAPKLATTTPTALGRRDRAGSVRGAFHSGRSILRGRARTPRDGRVARAASHAGEPRGTRRGSSGAGPAGSDRRSRSGRRDARSHQALRLCRSVHRRAGAGLVDPLLRCWPKLVQSAKEAGEIMSDKRSRRLLIVLSLLAGAARPAGLRRAPRYTTRRRTRRF